MVSSMEWRAWINKLWNKQAWLCRNARRVCVYRVHTQYIQHAYIISLICSAPSTIIIYFIQIISPCFKLKRFQRCAQITRHSHDRSKWFIFRDKRRRKHAIQIDERNVFALADAAQKQNNIYSLACCRVGSIYATYAQIHVTLRVEIFTKTRYSQRQ